MSQLSLLLSQLREEFSQLNPILITAPTQRCGTTLLQRAINSGGQAIIYGENFVLLEMLAHTLGGAVQNYDIKIDICNATLDAFKQGKSNIDGTALFPDFEGYIAQLLRGYYQNFDYYQRYSVQQGVKQWGFKHQPQNMAGFCNALVFLPQARVICVYRDVIDVARSMRARWPERLDSDAKLIAFGKRWASNVQQLLRSPKLVLTLKYEALIADPVSYIATIENILGIALDPEVFSHKINRHFTKNEVEHIATSAGDYALPADISAKEQALLLTHAQAMYIELGYGG